jgi:small subunit ribosomal protein S8
MLKRGNVMINDTIADMLTRLRNAHLAKKTSVVLRATRLTQNIAQLLFQEGFLSGIEPETNGMFKVTLKSSAKTFLRVSTPGVRVYVHRKELPRVLNGMGIAILSTSQGIMTDKKARACGIGGEVLCYFW